MKITWEDIDAVEGWLFMEEADLLTKLAKAMPPGCEWCEIGSYKGRSTLAFLRSGRMGYAIDWFQGSPEMPEGTNTLADFVKVLNKYDPICLVFTCMERSEVAVNNIPDHIGVLFIDGEHSYEAVKKDFELYKNKVVEGGYIVFHDAWGDEGQEGPPTPWPGVTQFVKELRDSPEWEETHKVRRCAAFRKIFIPEDQ